MAVYLFAPGISDVAYASVIAQIPWTFPYLCLISLCGYYTVILNIKGHLWVTSVLPVILNACLIFGALYANSIIMVAKMVLVAGILQLGLCLLVTSYVTKMPRLSIPKQSKRLNQFLNIVLQ